MTRFFLALVIVLIGLGGARVPASGPPTQVSYQGYLSHDGSPFSGAAAFKFAIVLPDSGQETTLWSNDGSSQHGEEPARGVVIPVNNGLFSVLLGGPGMRALTADDLANGSGSVLRVWVSTQGSFERLSDQPTASAPFALQTAGSGILQVERLVARGDDPDIELIMNPDSPNSLIELRFKNGDQQFARLFGSKVTESLSIEATGGICVSPNGTLDVDGIIQAQAQSGGGIAIRALNTVGQRVADIGNHAADNGIIQVFDAQGGERVRLSAMGGESSWITSGRLGIGTTTPASELDVNGRTRTDVLEITGADVVESFDTGGGHCAPGMVVVIDPEAPGQLRASTAPYDRSVAGVVSGAGGVPTGLYMGEGSILDGDTPVAMTGRVYILCSTENGPIRPGDLLTTSSTYGHAMKATDMNLASGAIVGKALTPLDSAMGLVLSLVSLQ